MNRKPYLLYGACWAVYMVFILLMFPVWDISAVIPVLGLIGMGAWLFGTRVALWMVLFSLIYHSYLLSVLYADLYEPYQTKLTSPLLLILISYVVGYLRKNYIAIRELNRLLDEKVSERTVRLSTLTDTLLHSSEDLKVDRGEILHDGIGQQLTAVQLLSSSLYEQLLNESDSTAAVADHLRTKARKVHLQIRSISRLLFPIRINQTGFSPAMEELTSSIRELKHVQLNVEGAGRLAPSSDMESLQLYRIGQETILHAIDHLGATNLSIKLGGASSTYLMRIKHNGAVPQAEYLKETEQLLQYRLNRISCSMKRDHSPSGRTVTVVSRLENTASETGAAA